MNRIFTSLEPAQQEQQEILFLWADKISIEEDFLLGKKCEYTPPEDDEE